MRIVRNAVLREEKGIQISPNKATHKTYKPYPQPSAVQ